MLFLNPDNFIGHLEELDARNATKEEKVRGYTVIVTRRFDWYAVGGRLPGDPDTETSPPTPAGRNA